MNNSVGTLYVSRNYVRHSVVGVDNLNSARGGNSKGTSLKSRYVHIVHNIGRGYICSGYYMIL